MASPKVAPAQTGFSTIEIAPEKQQELEACVAHNFAGCSNLENAIKGFLQDLDDMEAKRNKEQWNVTSIGSGSMDLDL